MTDISSSGIAGWLPRQVLVRSDAAVVTLHRAQLSDGGFVHERSIRWLSDSPRLIALQGLADEAVVPSGMIFHMTRCGSTLAARMVAAIEGATVVHEPSLLAGLLDPPAAAPLRLTQVLALYARATDRPGGPLMVKWGSRLNHRMARLQALFPHVPQLFVVRDPVEVLVSCVQRPMPLLERIDPGWLAPHLRVADLSRLDLAERAARYVGSHCFWAAQQRSLTVVEYRDLPAVVVDALPVALGCQPTADDRARIRERLRLDTKVHGQVFAPDAAAKQRAADARIRELAARIIEPELAAVLSRHPRLGTTTRST